MVLMTIVRSTLKRLWRVRRPHTAMESKLRAKVKRVKSHGNVAMSRTQVKPPAAKSTLKREATLRRVTPRVKTPAPPVERTPIVVMSPLVESANSETTNTQVQTSSPPLEYIPTLIVNRDDDSVGMGALVGHGESLPQPPSPNLRAIKAYLEEEHQMVLGAEVLAARRQAEEKQQEGRLKQDARFLEEARRRREEVEWMKKHGNLLQDTIQRIEADLVRAIDEEALRRAQDFIGLPNGVVVRPEVPARVLKFTAQSLRLYDWKWMKLQADEPLAPIPCVEMPWPVFDSVSRPDDVTLARVREFLFHPLRQTKGRTPLQTIEMEIERWGGSNFTEQLPKIQEKQQELAEQIASNVQWILHTMFRALAPAVEAKP